jgi:hypothetical protein
MWRRVEELPIQPRCGQHSGDTKRIREEVLHQQSWDAAWLPRADDPRQLGKQSCILLRIGGLLLLLAAEVDE